MGITGLFQFLKPVMKPSHVQALRGKTVAIDAMCWWVEVGLLIS